MKHTALFSVLEARSSSLRAHSRHLLPNVGTILIVALMLLAYNAWAARGANSDAAPPEGTTSDLLSYQGYLTDTSGTPLNGDVVITFRLYGTPAGGSALWTEPHTGGNKVPVSDGLFNVLLGSLVPIPTDVWSHDTLYLGVQVSGDAEMTPREVVSAVPVALTVPDGAIGTAQIADGGVKSNDLNLHHGTVCLSSLAEVDLPGGLYADVPGLSVDFSLDRPSQLLVWIDGLARFDQPSAGESKLILALDGSSQTGDYSGDSGWFNVNGQRLVDLDSGTHTLHVLAGSSKAGTMIVHGGRHYKTCINYLVLGEQ